ASALGRRGEIFQTRYKENLDSRYSELSHHVIGVVVVALGFMLVLEKAGVPAASALGTAVPILWFLGGLWVFVAGDTDAWPFQRTIADSLSDKMIVQHKILALGMMALGWAERRRRRGPGWNRVPVILFLAIAAGSGVMLQYHAREWVDPAHKAAF